MPRPFITSSSASLAETMTTGTVGLKSLRMRVRKSKPLIPGRLRSSIRQSGSPVVFISESAASAVLYENACISAFSIYIAMRLAISGTSSIMKMRGRLFIENSFCNYIPKS